VEVAKLASGLWRWTAPHPDWTPDEGGPDGWERDVGCVYWEARDAVVLVDPLAPPPGSEDAARFWAALDRDVERTARPVAILVTIFWHERSVPEVAARYDAAVWAHRLALERMDIAVSRPFDLGDPLPGGAVAVDAHRRGEVLYWLPDHRALVAGDVLLGDDGGSLRVCPDSWLEEELRGPGIRRALGPLLDLPADMVLVSHGRPVLRNARSALAAALTT
jgi:glyoxylase-like metal-dependent hydrolase (beta-lactamase superfamily II)